MTPYDLQQRFVEYKGSYYYVDDADDGSDGEDFISLLKYKNLSPDYSTWIEVPWSEHKNMEVLRYDSNK